MSKKAPAFGEEMNCQPKSLSIQAILNSVPTGSGESADKPIKKSLKWNKTSGLEMMGAPSMKQEPPILQGERMSGSSNALKSLGSRSVASALLFCRHLYRRTPLGSTFIDLSKFVEASGYPRVNHVASAGFNGALEPLLAEDLLA